MARAELLIQAKDIESYIPEIDPRRMQKPALIRGKNFLFGLDGPQSAFASAYANWYQFDYTTRRNMRHFRVNMRYFYGTPTGIWTIDPVSMLPQLLLPVTTFRQWWPWTFAQVGNLFYFAQYDVGLFQYNDITHTWTQIEAGNESVRGICAAYGRLVVFGPDTIRWSALDNGADFTPSLETGAGFQVLSILSKNAFHIDPVPDGVIISTDRGWIKGEAVAASYIFRWYITSTDVYMFNPNASAIINDVGLVALDANGFHLSTGTGAAAFQAGQAQQPWELLHGNYLKEHYLSTMDRTRNGALQIVYAHAFPALFVSIAPNMREGTFTNTFVYYPPSQKWGVFSQAHHGIFEVIRQPYNIDTTAYMDTDGYMRYFNTHKFTEILCPGQTMGDVVQRKPSEPDMIIVVSDARTTYFAESDINITTEQPIALANLSSSGMWSFGPRSVVETAEDTADPDWEILSP